MAVVHSASTRSLAAQWPLRIPRSPGAPQKPFPASAPPPASGPSSPQTSARDPQLPIHALSSLLARRPLPRLLQLRVLSPPDTCLPTYRKRQGPSSPATVPSLLQRGPPTLARAPNCSSSPSKLHPQTQTLVPSRPQPRPQSPGGYPTPIPSPALLTHPSVPGR
ncbi:vegetative cell wall protein gp1-like [Trachypithecus francoisi]|uniref:vegetative cell wall protein gp1-like n=1 Tax=Trachypithecus francoisi TaxID=54180 RepID=UPI00141B45F3|nr:vegetative cell wall protein gp1-like [Trachypithecus francoisi]